MVPVVYNSGSSICYSRNDKYDNQLDALAQALTVYSKKNEFFFPDSSNWEKLKSELSCDNIIGYIPDQTSRTIGNSMSKIIAWFEQDGYIYYVLADPQYSTKKFNFAKGELPIFYLYSDDMNAILKDHGQTILLLGIMRNDEYLVNDLINQQPALINVADLNGITPLMRAVSSQNLALVKKLVSNGAAITPRNIWQEDAVDIARKTKNRKMIEFLATAAK